MTGIRNTGNPPLTEPPLEKLLRATVVLRGERTARLRDEAKAEYEALLAVEAEARKIALATARNGVAVVDPAPAWWPLDDALLKLNVLRGVHG